MILDFFVVILTGLAVIVPFTIPWLEKKDKLKKTVYLIELIKTKDELKTIIEKVTNGNNSPILVDKLKKNLQEIENDINSSSRKFKINIFLLIISVEIFFVFNYLSNIIVQESWESGLPFFQGIFGYPAVRVVLILIIILMAYISTIFLSRRFYIKENIKSKVLYSFSMIAIFNVFLIITGMFTYFFLEYTDDMVYWY